MSVCGNCGSQQICTCSFISDGSVTLTGDGRSYSPINYRPNNVPLPRPYAYVTRTGANQNIGSSQVAKIVFDTNETPFASSMLVPDVQGTGLTIDRLIAPIDGYYLIFAFVAINTLTFSGNDVVSISKNATTTLVTQVGGVDAAPRSMLTLEPLLASDYIQVEVSAGPNPVNTLPTTGKTLSVITTTYPTFWAQWMRPL